MSANIKLKDLYNDELTYENISTIAVPKADGSGNEFYVKHPIINYTLLDPPSHELDVTEAQDIFAWNTGDGSITGVSADGNFFGAAYAAVTGKTTKPVIEVISWENLTGVTVNSAGRAHIIYLYEELTGAVLQEVIGYSGAVDFTAQVGWGQLLLDDNNDVTGYVKIDDPSAVSVGIEQPNTINDAAIFYALLSDATQETQNVSITENGTQTIVPTDGKSGIRKLTLTVDVSGGGGSDYYLLKNPTGKMSTYEDGYAMYLCSDDVLVPHFKPNIAACGGLNANAAVGFVDTTVFLYAYRYDDAYPLWWTDMFMVWYAEEAETIIEAVVREFAFEWTFGDVTLSKGWNMTTFAGNSDAVTATTTAVTLDAINAQMLAYGGIPTNNFDDWSTIDAYTLSFFKPSGSAELQEKTVSITQNGTTEVTPDSGYDGLSKVTIATNVPSSGGDVDAYKAAIYQYGDPAEDGCAIRTVWPASGIGLDLWAKASGKWNWASADYNYWRLWENTIKYYLNSDTLNSFAADLMTNLTSEFASIFEGGTKASFMDLEHVCTIPAIADSDPKTLGGLLAVLARSLDELTQYWVHDDFMNPPDYSFVFPETAIDSVFSPAGGDTVSIPFIMRPVVADGGTRMTGYNVQTPSGAMTTYETGFKSFANAGGGNPLVVGYCNAIPAYGITSELVAVIIASSASKLNVAWYSYGEQTLVNAVLQQFLPGLWTSDMGDVTLTEGWNMTAVQGGTPQTANNLTEAIVQEQLTAVFSEGIPAQLVSAYLAEMDDYEKSVFLPVTTPTYKYVGKRSLQINVTLAIPEDIT